MVEVFLGGNSLEKLHTRYALRTVVWLFLKVGNNKHDYTDNFEVVYIT
jgi:hypothetical protein